MNIMNSMRKLKKKKDKTTDKTISKRVIKTKKNKSENSCRSSRKKKTKEPSKSERRKKKGSKTPSASPGATNTPDTDTKTDTGADNFKDIFDTSTFAFKNEQSFEPASEGQTAAQKKAFDTFCRYATALGVDGLIKEYETLVVGYIPNGYYARAIFDQNTALKKNRYKDVVCNDLTRVILKDTTRPGDYIHANFVRGVTPPFILTQGPVKESIPEFWRMILQENVQLIIMLCEHVEGGKKKCVPYFNLAVNTTSPMVVADFVVTTEAVEQIDSHTLATTVNVMDKMTQKTQKVTHYKIVTWPDKTVAKSNLSILRTLRHVRSQQSPVVVHCSAGIGRTGTFAAIEVGIQCLLNGRNIRTCDIVRALRHCRVGSVQMDTQFLMLAEAIIDCGKSFKYVDDAQLFEQIEKFKADVAKYVQEHPPPPEVVKKVSKENVTNEETQIKTQNENDLGKFAPTAPAPVAAPPPQPQAPPPPPAPIQVTPTKTNNNSMFETQAISLAPQMVQQQHQGLSPQIEKKSTMTQPMTVQPTMYGAQGAGGAAMTTMTQVTYQPK